MSLSKQLYLGLTFVLALVFFSTLWINIDNTRSYIVDQLSSHAQDTATSLGLSIKPFIGNLDDLPMVEGMINVIFDNGYYQKIMLKNNQGKILFEKNNPVDFDTVPAWFVSLFPLAPPEASTEIHDGWVQPKTLHIISHPGLGYEQLWQSAVKSSWMIFGLFLLVGSLVSLILKPITDPIKKVAHQADKICQGDFVQVDDIPKTIELNLLVNAMNRMSRILQTMFAELTKQTEKYQQVAYICELTDLHNRRSFNNQFEMLLANKELACSGFIMIIRLSGLDSVNKKLGYVAGDEYIKTAVSIINETLHATAELNIHKAYRIVGSDFALVIQDDDIKHCQQLATKLIAKFNQAGNQAENDPEINRFAHIGITSFSAGHDISDVLVRADNALVKAHSDKQGWQFCTNTPSTSGNMAWKHELELLLVNKQVAFVAQPIVNIHNEVLYQELYARFTHTLENSVIPMGQLIAVAERLNLAEQFDKLVIEQALDKIVQLPSNLAFNLSPASLGNADFCLWLTNKLSQVSDVCKFITLEISEQSLFHHADNVGQLANTLKAMGCKITLEHFGASTCSFTHLMNIKPDYVKIDGCYCQDIIKSPENQLFIQSLVNIAHSLNIKVIAEFIETKAQQNVLQSLFVDYYQGYFINKPTDW